MNNTIYVTGHRHPDSDSICAAICTADLLHHLGKEAVACRQGPLNEESKFILKRFHQENPLLLTDARAMISDIEIDAPTLIHPSETVHHAWHLMLQTQNRSLVVVNDKGELEGVCTTSNLSAYRLQKDTDIDDLMKTASLENIARTIDGKILVKPDEFRTNGKIFIITLDDAGRFKLKESIVILTGNDEKQKHMIDEGAKCIILTCGIQPSAEVVDYARSRGCAMVTTQLDTMHAARIVPESYSVGNVMTKNIISFHENEYVTDVAQKMQKSRVRSYPVLDSSNKVVGAISRYHTLNYNRRKFILVDHSALNQTITHLEDAEIIAIIDHHHIGGIQTSQPILYRNARVGCTCTILSDLYQENGLLPDRDMSGLLLSAILSDTLNFRSATTTEMDRVAAKWLAKRAGIEDIDAYAREMLGASVALKDKSMHDILNGDLKNYKVGQYTFAIGQTNYSHMEEVQKLLPAFKENMKKEQEAAGLDLMVMLFTDVMGDGSLFVYYGPMSYVISEIIATQFDEHSGFDPGIISRKQQLMPKISQLLNAI